MKWAEKTLDELGAVSRGRSKHRPRDDPSLYGGKYPFIQTADVKNANFYISDYAQTYNETGLEQSKLWNPGTLCITIAANIAETGILSIDACFPDSIMGFIPYEGVSDVRFVKYSFDVLKKKFQQISQGTAQDNLSWEKLSTIKFPTPSLDIQRKIADILSAYDNLIENNQKQIRLLEEAARRLYKEWFVDFRFPGHESVPVVDGVPQGWSKVSLTDLLEIKYGKAHQTLENGDIPTYGSGGLVRKVKPVLYSGESVLIPRKGSLNNILYVCGDFWTIDTMFYSVPLVPNVAKFAYLFLSGLNMNSFNIGAAVPSMTVNILDGMRVLLPTENILGEFERMVSPFFDLKTVLLQQIEAATEARNRLLPVLMSGGVMI